jgi:hypothetical protein
MNGFFSLESFLSDDKKTIFRIFLSLTGQKESQLELLSDDNCSGDEGGVTNSFDEVMENA